MTKTLLNNEHVDKIHRSSSGYSSDSDDDEEEREVSEMQMIKDKIIILMKMMLLIKDKMILILRVQKRKRKMNQTRVKMESRIMEIRMTGLMLMTIIQVLRMKQVTVIWRQIRRRPGVLEYVDFHFHDQIFSAVTSC